MSQAPQFVISEFTNPSGEIAFRLTGWLDGKRIRKNLPSLAEAAAERQTMEIQQIQSATGVRTAATLERLNAYVGLMVSVATLVYPLRRNRRLITRKREYSRSARSGPESDDEG